MKPRFRPTLTAARGLRAAAAGPPLEERPGARGEDGQRGGEDAQPLRQAPRRHGLAQPPATGPREPSGRLITVRPGESGC